MPSLRYRRLWRAGSWLLLIVVAVLSLMPSPPQPPVVLVWDKAQHAVAYAVLGWSFLQAWEGRRPLRVAVALVAFGVVLEVLQSFTGARMFELADMLANAVGVTFGAALALGTPAGRIFGVAERALAYCTTK